MCMCYKRQLWERVLQTRPTNARGSREPPMQRQTFHGLPGRLPGAKAPLHTGADSKYATLGCFMALRSTSRRCSWPIQGIYNGREQ